MKKIVALVLCLVLALSLCTVAFAADPTGEYYALNPNTKTFDLVGNITYVKTAAKDPVVNRDKTIAKGNIEFYTIAGAAAEYCTVVSAAEADRKVVDGLTTIYLKKDANAQSAAAFEYDFAMTAYTKIGGKDCDALVAQSGATKYYSYTDADGKTAYACNATSGNLAALADGKIVTLKAADLNPHSFKGLAKNADSTAWATAKCEFCGAVATLYANKDLAGDNGVFVANWGWMVIGGAAAGTTTVESAKTFDAGIALYAGMALASVAGSAVVIGKKKEF